MLPIPEVNDWREEIIGKTVIFFILIIKIFIEREEIDALHP